MNRENSREMPHSEGAEFTLTNESEHSVLVNGRKIAPGEVIDTFRTDAEGKIETAKDLLPYGSYKLEETCPPTGYTRDGENLSRILPKCGKMEKSITLMRKILQQKTESAVLILPW